MTDPPSENRSTWNYSEPGTKCLVKMRIQRFTWNSVAGLLAAILTWQSLAGGLFHVEQKRSSLCAHQQLLYVYNST
jgi:hypothetical protein